MVSGASIGVTSYSTPSDREIVITRVFDAPRRMVYEAWTNPQYIPRWMVPDDWTMPICEMDLRPGGAWRYQYRKGDGAEMTLSGTIREAVPPERLVSTERWGPEWPETVNTLVLAESGGRTTATLTVTYPSKEARDAALQTGMKEGMEQGFAKLDTLFRTLA
jgi:uncharacterized protein YndB with AHSA1/START domain